MITRDEEEGRDQEMVSCPRDLLENHLDNSHELLSLSEWRRSTTNSNARMLENLERDIERLSQILNTTRQRHE